ncbi:MULTISPECIES: 1-phosphofructokinase [unclassified Breznakia]|uniref:1-phosphofructokinase n=1 Tax=unclassified Breznakia TaxID=2623764 RepID=UPI0024052A02|nr:MULTISPECIES: 1-phosphofructokinase [unclassified Breznakia]MDF9837545.1 1-phosphofructokinase [Breznakia sp. PFB2-8]MDF9859122.1 1-phosphofructokinase [Breznakia sp. PH5-24]
MIVTVTMNPAIDKTAEVDEFIVGGLNRLQNTMINPGGKGINVSKTIQHLGGESIAMGFVAGASGRYIVDALNDYHIKNNMIEVVGNTRTNLKILNSKMKLTELNEEGPIITKEALDLLCNQIIQCVNQDDIVVLSGSVPSTVTKDIYAEIIHKVKQKDVKVILDADGDLFKNSVVEVPTIIKPNRYELCQYFKIDENCSLEELLNKGKLFLDAGIEMIVISMGSDGAVFMNNDHTAIVKGLKVEAHSSVGAGDAMVAGIAYALERKFSFDDLIKLSVATSAGAVMTKGTQPADRKIVDDLMKKVQIQKIK